MITRIHLLRNIGQFDSVAPAASIALVIGKIGESQRVAQSDLSIAIGGGPARRTSSFPFV
jgi:hypothetical protein